MSKTEIIVIHESIAQSWARDLSTLALFSGMIGIGIALDSSAMQWVGAIIAFGAMWARVSGASRKMSTAEARNRLDEIDAALAEEQR